MTDFSGIMKQNFAAACKHAWSAYVWSFQLVPHILLAYVLLTVGMAYLQTPPSLHPDATIFSSPPPSGRGVTRPVFCVPVYPLFHPDAHPIALGGAPAANMAQRFLDILVPLLVEMTLLALSKVADLVGFIKRTYQISTGTINAAMAPLSTRLNRGIVQLSSLPNESIYQATIRHLRLLSALVCVVISLLIFAGPSLKLAMALGFCGVVLIVTRSTRGPAHQDIAAPGMANVGLISALEAQEDTRLAV